MNSPDDPDAALKTFDIAWAAEAGYIRWRADRIAGKSVEYIEHGAVSLVGDAECPAADRLRYSFWYSPTADIPQV
jgi:hypothetical protein